MTVFIGATGSSVSINLVLNEAGLKKFKSIPTFRNLLHPNQISQLRVGANTLLGNRYVWGTIQRVVKYDSENMSVSKAK